MSLQFNNPYADLSKQFAAATLKANSLALGSASRLFDLHVKTLEDRLDANVSFVSELGEARSFDDIKAVYPKGAELARNNVERVYAASQEALADAVKTNEEIGKVLKKTFEAASAEAAKTAQKAAQAK